MSTMTLAVDALMGYVLAVVYVVIGALLTRRHVEPDAQLALRLFGVWWWGLAGTTAVGATLSALAVAGLATFPLVLTLTHLSWVFVVVALWGLLFYLVYLFTGRKESLVPISVFYVAYWLFIMYLIAWGRPDAVDVGAWNVTVTYERPFTGAVVFAAIFLLLAPHLLGAVAYAALWFRAETRTQRYRIGMVAGAVLVWFGTAALGSALGWGRTGWWPYVSQVVALLAALAILAAYRPPGWVQARWGVAGTRASDTRRPDGNA